VAARCCDGVFGILDVWFLVNQSLVICEGVEDDSWIKVFSNDKCKLGV